MTEQHKRNIVTAVILSIFAFFAVYSPANAAGKGIRIFANVVPSYKPDHDTMNYSLIENVYCADNKEYKVSMHVNNSSKTDNVVFIRKCEDNQVKYVLDTSKRQNSDSFKSIVSDKEHINIKINNNIRVIEP